MAGQRSLKFASPLRLLAYSVLILAVGSCWLGNVARGQGVLINVNVNDSIRLPRPIIIYHPHPHPTPRPAPVPQATYKIKELSMQAKISDQVAKVQVSQSFVNTGSTQMEVSFVFPLPYDGAVDRLTLLVDNKEYEAKLLDAKKAREMYEAIVRKNKDPALLEWLGSGLFKTSVFPIPPGAERTVTLRYSQLCRKNHGLTEFLFPLSTAKYTSHAVEKLNLQVSIESAADIKNVYSPTHTVEVHRADDNHASINFIAKNEFPSSDFRLFYDVGKKDVQANVISYRPDKDEDGYYLLLASPKIKAKNKNDRTAKTVLFVVDRSGSMAGEKIKQAKGALKFVLNNLQEDDTFNIIAYDSEVESFRPELQKFDDKTRSAALGFVEGLYAGGSTNISGALKTAFGQLQDSERPTYVIFLTDGLPTHGETNEAKIDEIARKANELRARLFPFGVGYDVNSRLLDKLARANFGQSEYVRPNEDIEDSVSKLYNRIGSPVMTELAIKFDLEGSKTEDGPSVNRVYPRDPYDLFAGEQLIQVGRYKNTGDAKVVITGKVGSKKQKLDFPAEFVKKSNDQTNAFVEKLWAMRRVGEIIDQIDLNGKNDELIKELVNLATKHGILTPYTSFLADENSDHRDVAGNRTRTFNSLDKLAETNGRSGVAQRAAKGQYQRAAAAAPSANFGAGGGGLAPAADASPAEAKELMAKRNQQAGKAAQGSAYYFDAEAGEAVVVDTVRNVGQKTFFLRNGQWVDSSLTKEEEAKPQKLERFSKEYFELAEKLGRSGAQYLAIDDPVIVKLDGQAYQY